MLVAEEKEGHYISGEIVIVTRVGCSEGRRSSGRGLSRGPVEGRRDVQSLKVDTVSGVCINDLGSVACEGKGWPHRRELYSLGIGIETP